MDIEQYKNTIQDCNLNFLVGSGMSVPYFSTLGNIEVLLTDLERNTTLTSDEKIIIRASILGKYFKSVILKNPEIIDDSKPDDERDSVLQNYCDFLVNLNTIVLKRKSTILNKQVNIFTTNIDVFFEKALENAQLEYNDGFYGRYKPVFNLTNFKKSLFKKSLHYDNTSEIPVFNLLKLHGSLTWETNGDRIVFSNLQSIESVKLKFEQIESDLIDFNTSDTIYTHFTDAVKAKSIKAEYSDFLEEYKKFAVVNPTKEKFKDTILNLQYYELLRLFSNELEKENTILIVFGFSMADEHIRDIITRAANSNPTLTIKVFAYNTKAKSEIEENIKKGSASIRYNNIEVIEHDDSAKNYDLKTFNEDFLKAILEKID
tara:strand:+ start:926 stop:2047 length:1122 start_codon:yes stop_codon:yes gene_type:complete